MKLPEPVPVAIVFATGEEIPGYTAEQMLAWGKACAAAEREACARICDDKYKEFPQEENDFAYAESAKGIAAAIRARGTT